MEWKWFTENGLALYGAVTGTAALLITFSSHRLNVKKDQIKLAISYAEHSEKSENIERLNTQNTERPWDQPQIIEVYVITVRNLGSIPAPLDEVGIIDNDGNKHQALVRARMSQMNLLQPITESNVEPLEPRAARTFSVYLRRDEPTFSAVSAYAIDQTGKKWSGRT
jgi:hypothetical protein